MAQPQRKELHPRSVRHESIDGTLSGSVLQFNLAGELDQLHRDEAWLPPTGRSSKTLVKYPDLRIVLIAMKANTRMHEHTAAGNEPAEPESVLDALDELTRAGMLDACGSDFYMLTERGKGTIAQSWVVDNTCPSPRTVVRKQQYEPDEKSR
jgi:hypothetical protein